MKKTMIILAAVGMAACTKVNFVNERDVHFSIKGDFGSPTFSRATLNSENMTDLWLVDYMGGELKQCVHLTKEDAGFSSPTLTMEYGQHHVYIVASRGVEPVVDNAAHTIVWSSPRDTFWKDATVNVTATAGSSSVTLDRVVSRLRVVVTDKVPEGSTTFNMSASKWYNGIDYLSGQPVAEEAVSRNVSIPGSYIGTVGQLSVSFFGFSGTEEWTTNITVSVMDANGDAISSKNISNAPFVRNRSTDYSGMMFASSSGMTMTLNADWATPVTATF